MGIIRHSSFLPLVQVPSDRIDTGAPIVSPVNRSSDIAAPVNLPGDKAAIKVLTDGIASLQEIVASEAQAGPSSLRTNPAANDIASNFVTWYQKLGLRGIHLNPQEKIHRELIVSLLEVHLFRPNTSPSRVAHDMIGTMRQLGLISENPAIVQFWSDNFSKASPHLSEFFRTYGTISIQGTREIYTLVGQVDHEPTSQALLELVDRTDDSLTEIGVRNQLARINNSDSAFNRIASYIGYPFAKCGREPLVELYQLLGEEGTWQALGEFRKDWALPTIEGGLADNSTQALRLFVELKKAERQGGFLSPDVAKLLLEVEQYYSKDVQKNLDLQFRQIQQQEGRLTRRTKAEYALRQIRKIQNQFYPVRASSIPSTAFATWGIFAEDQGIQGPYRASAANPTNLKSLLGYVHISDYENAAKDLVIQLRTSGFHFVESVDSSELVSQLLRVSHAMGSTPEEALHSTLNFLSESKLIHKSSRALVSSRYLEDSLSALNKFLNQMQAAGFDSDDAKILKDRLKVLKTPSPLQAALDRFLNHVYGTRGRLLTQMFLRRAPGSKYSSRIRNAAVRAREISQSPNPLKLIEVPREKIEYSPEIFHEIRAEDRLANPSPTEGMEPVAVSEKPGAAAISEPTKPALKTGKPVLQAEPAEMPTAISAQEVHKPEGMPKREVTIIREGPAEQARTPQIVEMQNLRGKSAGRINPTPVLEVVVDSAIPMAVEAASGNNSSWLAIDGGPVAEVPSALAPTPEMATHSGELAEINFSQRQNAAMARGGRILSTGLNIFGGGLSVIIAIAETQQAYEDPNFLNLIGAGTSHISAGGFLTAGLARAVSFIPHITPGTLVFAERTVERGMFVGQFAGGAVAAVLGMRYFVDDIHDKNASWFRSSTGPLMTIGGVAMSSIAWVGRQGKSAASTVAEARHVVRNPLTLAGIALMAFETAVGVGREYAIEYDTVKALRQIISPMIQRENYPSQEFDQNNFEAELAPIIKDGYLDDDVIHELVKIYSGRNYNSQNFLKDPLFNAPLFGPHTQVDLTKIPSWMHGKTLLEIFDAIVTGNDGAWNIYSSADQAAHEAIQGAMR